MHIYKWNVYHTARKRFRITLLPKTIYIQLWTKVICISFQKETE